MKKIILILLAISIIKLTNAQWVFSNEFTDQFSLEIDQLMKQSIEDSDQVKGKLDQLLNNQSTGNGKWQGLGFWVPGKVDFPQIITDTETTTHSAELKKKDHHLTLTDARLPSPGWTVTATANHLNDNTGGIDVKNLLINPKGFRPFLQNPEGISLGEKKRFENENDPALIIQSSAGNGFGLFEVYIDLELTIPANTPAGNYKGQLIFTVQ